MDGFSKPSGGQGSGSSCRTAGRERLLHVARSSKQISETKYRARASFSFMSAENLPRVGASEHSICTCGLELLACPVLIWKSSKDLRVVDLRESEHENGAASAIHGGRGGGP